MRYSLPALATNEESLHQVQTKILATMLQRLGVSSKIPTAIRHGPEELAGMALIDLQTESGIETIQCLRNAVYKDTGAGRLMTLTLQLSQLESGISSPLLEYPEKMISYLTPTWITSIRQFLYLHNITIKLTIQLTPQMRGGHFDKCIMDSKEVERYSPQQKLDLNLSTNQCF